MFVTNAAQVRDYRLCKHLFNSRHNLHKPERSGPERDKIVEKFDDAMRKLVKRAYFHTMGDGGFPTMDRLLYEWDRIWHDGRTVDSILEEQNSPDKSVDSFNTEAIRMIRLFHKRNHENPGTVAGILGEDYFVQLDNGAVISGTIDLVIERDGQLVIPHYTTRKPANFREGNLGYTKLVLDSIAFRAKTGRTENFAAVEYMWSGRTQPIVVTDVVTREVTDIIAEMATRTRWPAEECYWCNRCSFSKECPTWQG